MRVIAAWWAACLLWSTTFLFIRVGLADIPPLTLASARLAIAVVFLVPLARAGGHFRELRWVDVGYVAAAGLLLLGVNYALLFWGAQFVPSGLVAILQSGTPLIALGLAFLVGQERVTLWKTATLLLGVVGVALIFGSEAVVGGRTAIAGIVAVFASSVCVAAAYVWMKRHKGRIPPLAVTAIQSATAVVPLMCLAWVLEGSPAPARWSFAAWAALIYLGIAASVLAFWLNYWLLARMDASAMLMMGVAEVPIAIALGAVFLEERLPAGTFVGASCVLVGVAGSLLGERAAKAAAR